MVISGAAAKAISIAIIDFEKGRASDDATGLARWNAADYEVEIGEAGDEFVVLVAPASPKIKGGDVEYRIDAATYSIKSRHRGK